MVALRWFDDEPELSPFLKALEDVRRKATREGGAMRTCRPSLWLSINTRKRRRAIGSIS